jgi:CHAD domain-containing protein
MTRALIPPGETSAAALQPEWRQRLAAWRTFLSQCGSKPNRKSVHALRALSLRLWVEMEHSLPEQAGDSAAARTFQRWSKEAKKLRKVLGPVRDADVYLTRLDSLRDSLVLQSTKNGMDSHPIARKKAKGSGTGNQCLPVESSCDAPSSARCTREIEKLENRLRRKRLAGIEELVAFLGERGKRLNRLSNEMEAAFAPRMSATATSTTQATLKIIAGLADELPSLNAANLHEYRKRLKPALYLADISAAADPLAARQSVALRKIHDAIGEWHDWQALAQQADRVLHSHGEPDGLVPVLEARAKTALHRALGQCRRSAKKTGAMRTSEPKKPVAAERGLQLEDQGLKVASSR